MRLKNCPFASRMAATFVRRTVVSFARPPRVSWLQQVHECYWLDSALRKLAGLSMSDRHRQNMKPKSGITQIVLLRKKVSVKLDFK